MSFKTLAVLTVLALIARSSHGKIALEEFYPYGEKHGDTNLKPLVGDDLDDGSSPAVPLSHPFKFFSSSHSALYVNINGGVSFIRPIPKYTPECNSLSEDMSMIAPFWADVDLRATHSDGAITFRQSTDETLLAKALHDVTTAFPDQIDKLKWAFIATWFKVGFYGEQITYTNKSNTFQMALVTDGLNSYAIFNYNDIEWTTGTASGGSRLGLGGHPARAGFDNGHRLTILDGSCTDAVIQIADKTDKNVPGKFVFKVDSDTIVRPGSSTMKVVTEHPVTEATTGTPSPDDIKKKKDDLEDRIKNLRLRVMVDCDKLIERPALERECYIELERLNNLLHELHLTKYMHELVQIEQELERIAMVMDRIEQDISLRMLRSRLFKAL